MGISSTEKVKLELSQDQYESTPRWEAHLNNGLTVYSDGNYIDGKSDWERLQDFVVTNNLIIEKFLIAFRDHKVIVNQNCTHKNYFRRMFLGSITGESKEYFIVGSGDSPLITVYKYALPEMMLFESEKREVKPEDLI